MKHNSDFRYDLEVGQVKENELASIIQNKKIEVKTDLQAYETGNVYVEYESRGKPSGISTSQADYYCFVISKDTFIFISSAELKKRCRRLLNTDRDRKGGDSNTSKGILLPVTHLL